MTKLFIFIFILLFGLTGCSPTIKHQHELEMAIADNFTAPTNNFDTLLLEPSRAEFPCPPTKEISDKVFNSRIDSSIYLSILSKNIDKPIVIWTAEKAESVYNNFFTKNGDYKSEYKEWRLFFNKRLQMTLDGEINNNTSVNITATFKNKDTMWTIEKQFNFTNDKWTGKAVYNGSTILSDDFTSTLEK